ncbi:testis-specific serine/threonine-protein kinase 1-like [Lycodopsis pacificus]
MNTLFMERHGYTFRNNLGEGMFGKVVSADSVRLREKVAIKFIDRKRLSHMETFLCREMEISRTLNHPNIVKTLEIFKWRTSKVYVVMEFCVNGDLLKHITLKGALTENESCRLFTQLCNALQYLHNSDVAHRDLKCENILLDRHFNLKVCDFGFSKRLTYADGRMMLSKTFCGTLSYSAHEIVRRLPYNPKVSDVWSMGVVLHMMLHASKPFDTTNIKRMLTMQSQRNVKFPNSPSVSYEAKDLIQRILHPVVKHRITITDILQSSWMLREGKMEDSEEALTSNAGSGKKGPPDEKAKEEEKLLKANSEPREEPSSTAP